jgi:hypothetical protein
MIDLGIDIHFDNDLLLFYACRTRNIKFVELLLKNESMHPSILLFPRTDLRKYKYTEISSYTDNNSCDYIEIAELLIKYGAVITDPLYIFCIYMHCADKYSIKIDNLFIILLDLGIDLNVRHPFYHKYVFERVIHYPILIKLCLEYGADPHIGNYAPLIEAIRISNVVSIKLLLDLGSVLDPNLGGDISEAVFNLLSAYEITHKLKCTSC